MNCILMLSGARMLFMQKVSQLIQVVLLMQHVINITSMLKSPTTIQKNFKMCDNLQKYI